MGLFTDGFKLLKKASEPLYKTPKSIQETIEIMAVAENGIFEVSKNKYSKCYRFQDINYTTATEDEQIGIFERYCKFLNSLDCNYKITINNKNKNINDGRGIVFATGTPISNTMCEMYVMQLYLQKAALEEMGIYHFDSWAANFGEVTTALELTVEGSGFRFKSRFNKFTNLPELMNIFREVADVQTADMLDLDVPALRGGKPIIVESEPDWYVKQVMEDFVVRAERIRGGGVDPSVDNFLKITHSFACVLPDTLTSPQLTAEWENNLTQIAKDKADPAAFMEGIEDMARELVKTYPFLSDDKAQMFKPEREALGSCPRCGSPVYEGKKNYYCSNKECIFTMWKNDRFFEERKVTFTPKIAAALLKSGRVNVKKLYSPKTGKTYDGTIVLADTGGKYVNYRIELPKKK